MEQQNQQSQLDNVCGCRIYTQDRHSPLKTHIRLSETLAAKDTAALGDDSKMVQGLKLL